MATVIPVSESQYLGSLELLGRVWAGDDVPVFSGSSPLVAYVNQLSACDPAPMSLVLAAVRTHIVGRAA
jgi:hypothetical protein